ncbi:lipopolysaccharide kinase InaA family protein [Anaerobaca lacustris]|uniref:Lipopolysaccharide kinase InaA family protein n=1 Tax=Anaerobaca lacustris TaxID=3044600 RepID=A0AAW6U3F4_9BACT|nr:lipopolysaccharide kinase InaA family protein [Sedimentisphaerales bacterium M17dextr]
MEIVRVMDKVVFAESWEPYFAALGLRTFDDFYDYPETLTVNRNRKRDVLKLALGEGADRKIFFMKRFHDPHLKDILATRSGLGGLTSQAGVEWRNARHLLKNGIGTYEPVCMGERTRWGLEKASFFVTRQLDGVCLLDLVEESWQGLDRGRQEKIIVAVANLARTLHGLDISLPDLQIWHLYLGADGPSGEDRLSVIDLHRMAQGVRSDKRKAKNLARLLWSMLPEYFDEDHRQLLLDSYFINHGGARRQGLLRYIERVEATFNRRHTARRYYRNTQVASP